MVSSTTIVYATTITFIPGIGPIAASTSTYATSVFPITASSNDHISLPSSGAASITSSTQTPALEISSSIPGILSSGPSSSSGTLITPTSSETLATATGSGVATEAPGQSSTSSPKAVANSNTPLVAGIGVLAALLAIALIAIAFLAFRQRRRRAPPPRLAGELAANEKFRGHELSSSDPTLASLQLELSAKNAELRQAQSALLDSGKRTGPAGLDDKYVNGQFAKLNKDINDWVLTHFKHAKSALVPGLSPDVEVLLTMKHPNYTKMLQDSRTRYILLRAIAADILLDAFVSGEILGREDFSRMNSVVGSQASAEKSAQWRALTMSILPKDPTGQSAAVDRVTERIDRSTSSLVGLTPSTSRIQQLQSVVQDAAELAAKLAQQRATFQVLQAQSSTFDASTMEDVLQEQKGEALRGRKIQSSVFPSVVRYGDDAGQGYDRATMISKALVLV